MGLSGSAYNMFLFINRKNDIELGLTKLSMEKSQLAREMEKISTKYQNAISQKTYKWSNNAGSTYVDLTYNNLMKPSAMNLQKPYLLTDLNDRVIVDSDYKKYAEMISPDGSSGGDWYGNREKILAQLTGASEEDLAKQAAMEVEMYYRRDDLEKAKANEPDKHSYMAKGNFEEMLEASSLATESNVDDNASTTATFENKSSNWLDAYRNNDTIRVNASGDQNQHDIIMGFVAENLRELFADKSDEEIENVINSAFLDPVNSAGASVNSDWIKADGEEYVIHVKPMIDSILGTFTEPIQCETGKSDRCYYWTNADYSDYQGAYNNWKTTELDPAQEAYDNAAKAYNELFEGGEETLINFYDAIFSTIAEKGWTYNPNVQDNEYVEQMLQNNLYLITTVDREAEHNDIEKTCTYKNNYDSRIASNFNKLFLVNDKEAAQEALVEYEMAKAIIERKESEIDVMMKNLETELAAVKAMIEQVQKIAKENSDRTMEFQA